MKPSACQRTFWRFGRGFLGKRVFVRVLCTLEQSPLDEMNQPSLTARSQILIPLHTLSLPSYPRILVKQKLWVKVPGSVGGVEEAEGSEGTPRPPAQRDGRNNDHGRRRRRRHGPYENQLLEYECESGVLDWPT